MSPIALVARVGIKAAMGYNPQWDKSKPGQRPVTRMGALSLLRRRLHDVKQKLAKRDKSRGKKKDDIEFGAEEVRGFGFPRDVLPHTVPLQDDVL